MSSFSRLEVLPLRLSLDTRRVSELPFSDIGGKSPRPVATSAVSKSSQAKQAESLSPLDRRSLSHPATGENVFEKALLNPSQELAVLHAHANAPSGKRIPRWLPIVAGLAVVAIHFLPS